MTIHNLFPPATPAGNGATSDTNVPGRGVVYLHRGIAHLQLRSLDDIAREHGVEAQPSVDIYAQFRPEPSLWQRIKAMREDVPEAVRLVIGDIRAAPQSHALVAIAAFNLPLLALLIGAWWVGALS